MKPTFALRWLFVCTSIVALFFAGFSHPGQLMAVVLTTAVLTSFMIGVAFWLGKGERCPGMICSYVVIGGFAFVSPACVAPLLPERLLEPQMFIVSRWIKPAFGEFATAFAIAHCWLTVLYGLAGTGVVWGFLRLTGNGAATQR
jgi:hypothetical protein